MCHAKSIFFFFRLIKPGIPVPALLEVFFIFFPCLFVGSEQRHCILKEKKSEK